MSEIQSESPQTSEAAAPGGDGDGQFHVGRLLWFLVIAAAIVVAAVIFNARS